MLLYLSLVFSETTRTHHFGADGPVFEAVGRTKRKNDDRRKYIGVLISP